MRNLIVTRGLPGSGKSHTLGRLGLADFTLGADSLRLVMASPALTSRGTFAISAENDGRVWAMIYDTLEKRMSRGETVVVDATHPTADTFKTYLSLARDYRYQVACLDFSEVPQDVVHWHNDGRDDYRRVPQHAIDRISASMAAGHVPETIRRIMVRSDGRHLKEVSDWLAVPELDLNAYKRVMHIGDIQGCFTAVTDLLGAGGLRDDTFYIFIGDACDRGDENGLVMRWLIDEVIDQPNVAFLWGNHEDHLYREALGQPPVSGEFAAKTRPQLHEAGVTRDELHGFCIKLKDMLLYRHGKTSVMATHAGLPTVPQTLWMLPARQCSHGTGYYEDDVDTQFALSAPPGWCQVHGHRNHHDRPIQASRTSYNLEGKVEDGGYMRGVVLEGDVFESIQVGNRVFRPFRQRKHHRMTIVPQWMQAGTEDGTVASADLVAAMQAHPGVRPRPSLTFPHVVSMNFTKAVFYDKSWDSVTVKARGLYFDTGDWSIVSRSYDKFFTIGERPETSMASLKDTLVFPLTMWVKENGFLGILGYDKRTDRLFSSSKSSAEGPFADWFREILDDALPNAEKMAALTRFLRDTESSMPFEVIDPVRDPHMVDYPTRKLVLLDVVHRSTEFSKLSYEDLEKVGNKFGFEVKQRGMVFKDWASFEGWHRKAMSGFGKQIEGYVIEDAAGRQVKEKLPWYSFWKLCRGMTEALVRERDPNGKGKNVQPMGMEFLEGRGLGFAYQLGFEFYEWCREQDTATLKADIITLRKSFEAHRLENTNEAVPTKSRGYTK